MPSPEIPFNILEAVKWIPIFAKLNWADQQRIARKCLIQEYRKGDWIVREGTPPDFFYCVLSGRVQSFAFDAGGQKSHPEHLHRGMYFGIISVFTGETHSINYQAINDSLLLKIPKEDFHKLLDDISHLGVEFSKILSQNIRRRVKGAQEVFESQIISVYSPVAGTGSSTYALNLALSLQKQTRKRVIFVQIDSTNGDSREASLSSSIQWKRPAVDLMEISEGYEKISSQVVTNGLAVDILNVSLRYPSGAPADEHQAFVDDVRKKISVLLSALVGSYHYVVADLPNDQDEAVMESLTQSDLIHIMVQDREEDLTSGRLIIERLKTIMKESFQEEKFFVLVRPSEDKMVLSFEEMNKTLNYKVHKVLPFTELSGFQSIETPFLTFLVPDENSAYQKVVISTAREIGRVLVGLVLGGGAALGIAHIGVLKVLERERIPIDIVVGSSMGALIGSLWATGMNAQEVEAVAREFGTKRSLSKLLDPVIPVSALIDGGQIKRWLKKKFESKTFYDCQIPLKVMAYDLKNRQELVLESGSLVDAVRQSVSIPGVMRPVMKENQMIIDGGVLNPLPTNVLLSRGVKKIIAVNVLQSAEHVNRGELLKQAFIRNKLKMKFFSAPWEFIKFRFGLGLAKAFNPNIADIIVKTLQASEYLIAEQSAHQADVVIHPDLTGIDWFELYRVDELIKAGEQAAVKMLPQIKHLVES